MDVGKLLTTSDSITIRRKSENETLKTFYSSNWRRSVGCQHDPQFRDGRGPKGRAAENEDPQLSLDPRPPTDLMIDSNGAISTTAMLHLTPLWNQSHNSSLSTPLPTTALLPMRIALRVPTLPPTPPPFTKDTNTLHKHHHCADTSTDISCPTRGGSVRGRPHRHQNNAHDSPWCFGHHEERRPLGS